MKLHAFDIEKDGERFRAFTRDKARKSLKKPIFIPHLDDRVQPHEWLYAGVVSTTGTESDYIKELHARIKRDGFAIVSMPPILRHFYVFDVQLDIADIRVYSADRELSTFKEARYRMELSPKGSYLKGEEPEFIGELKIPDADSANRLGLDYRSLQEKGFDIAVVRQSSYEEVLRRGLQREVPKIFPEFEEKYGIEITSFTVGDVRTVKDSDASSNIETTNTAAPTAQNIDIRIENSNVIESAPKENTNTGRSFFDWWIVKLLGLLAAIAGLVALFMNK